MGSVNLKIRGLEPVDFVRLRSRLWDWNPWIFRVHILILGTRDHEFLTRPLQHLYKNEATSHFSLDSNYVYTYIAFVKMQVV